MKHIKLFEEFIDEQVVNEKASGDDEITITSVNIDHYYEILSTEKTDELDSIIPKDEKEFNIKIEMTKSGPILFNITGKKKDLLNFLRNKLDSTYAIKKRFPELYEEAGPNLKSQSYINENNPGDKLKHKYNPAIEIELIEPTNRGWKVYQIEKGKKKIAHFDKQDISGDKSLFN